MDNPTPTPTPNISITSHDQRGGFTGINQGTVNLGPHRREITPAQETTMLSALANGPKGKVETFANGSDQEAVNFQQRIAGILEKAGFEVIQWTVSYVGKGPVGITLRVKDEKNIPAHATAIKNAMFKAGFEGSARIDPTLGPLDDANNLFIDVGANPANQ